MQDGKGHQTSKSFMIINDHERLTEEKFQGEKQLQKVRQFVQQPVQFQVSIDNHLDKKKRSVVYANNY